MAEQSIKFIWRSYWYGEQVAKKLDDTTFKTIQHAAASVRLYAVRSIKRSRRPARPGEPVHTQTRRLPKAIVYAVDRKRMVAVIGPSFDKIGLVGHAHEFGGTFRGDHYDKRSYMGPAAEKVAPRLPSTWAAYYRT